MLEDWKTAPVDARTRAALGLLEAMTLRPQEVTSDLVSQGRAAGLDDGALRALAATSFQFNLMNRLADAFDFALPDARQKARMARMLDAMGRRMTGSKAGAPSVRGADGRLRPPELEEARVVLLRAPGVTPPLLRRQAASLVRAAWEEPAGGAASISDAWDPYLRTLARHAYRIVDEDMDALRAEGSPDEAIYEVTLVGSVTAALVGVEALFAAL